MSGPFAQGKHAFGFCDRCGFRYELAELKKETIKGVTRNLKVCPECWNVDHPQNFLGMLKVDDPQSLREPRPDMNLDRDNGFFGWSPVGNPLTKATVSVGTVSVTTS